ncbi:nuclear pore complex protein NUP98A [Tanacetum coccineum]
MPSNHPACSPSVFGHTNNPDKSPFGTTSPFGAQTGGSNSSSTGVFVGTQASSPEESTSVFGPSSSPAFGRSTPAFGTPSSPAFGTTSTSPFGGSSVFEQNPASECPGFTIPSSPFGNPSQESQPTMSVLCTPTLEASNKPAFGVSGIPASATSVTPAFGVSSIPASGSNSTPAFGSTGSAFGVSNSPFGSTTPAFGTLPPRACCSTPSTGSSFSFASAPAFDHSPTPFGVTSIPVSPFGAHATTSAFGDHGFSLFNQPPVGSRVYSYAQTPEEVDWRSGPQPLNLESISAMPAYKGKTHEELRWEDYQSGDKGGPNPASQSSDGTEFKTNNMRSNLFSTPFRPATSPFSSARSTNPFAQTTFGTPRFVSSSHTLKSSPFWPPTSNPSTPAQSQTPSPSSYPFGTPTSPSPFGTPDTSNPFGPAQAQTPSVFYTTPSNPFGPPTSHSFFGTPNTSGFGTPSSIPTFGVSVTVALGAPATPVFGASSSPAFTASITPAFGSLPTPAYGATSFSFSFSFPVFGQSASALGNSPFGAHAAAPDFASYGSGQPYQQHVGSVSPPYAQTSKIFSSNGTQPAEKLESISATRTYKEKCLEEVRWDDYQSGDKGGQTSNLSGSAQSQTPSSFRATNIFGATTPSPFGTPNTSNSGTSTSIFGTTQARGTNSMFANTQASHLFQSSSAAIGQMNTGPYFGQSTSPSFGFSTPIGTKNTSSSGTSTTSPGFGARTSPSPFNTPNTSTSVSGSTPGLGATMSPSPFGTPNTSSASATSNTSNTSPSPFETSNTSTCVSGLTPCFGAITLPSSFGSESSMGIAFEQSTSAFSQSNASEGMFASTPLSTSSMGFNQTTSSFSTSSQFAQPTQSPVSSHLGETTGGTGSPSNVSIDDQAD